MNLMAISPSDKEFLKYFNQLDEPQKKSLLELIKTFLTRPKDQTQRVTIEQYNQDIEEAMLQIERGEVYTHEEVMKMAKDW